METMRMNETVESRTCPRCGGSTLKVFYSDNGEERLGVWCESCSLDSLKAYAACGCIEWTSSDYGYHWHGEKYAITSDGKRDRNKVIGEIEAGSGSDLKSPPWNVESARKITCQHCGGQVSFWPAFDW